MIAYLGIADIPPRLVIPYCNHMGADFCTLKCARTMSQGITDVCMNFVTLSIFHSNQLTSPGPQVTREVNTRLPWQIAQVYLNERIPNSIHMESRKMLTQLACTCFRQMWMHSRCMH